MKKLLLITFILAGCSPSWHVKKAVKKGWTPEKETIEVERLELIHTRDSITNEIIRVDTVRLKEMRTIFQDRPLLRYETRLIRDTIRIKEKADTRQIEARLKHEYKKAIDTIKAEKKRFPWRLIFMVFVAGVLIGTFRKQIFQIVRKLVIKV
jgi:hypothetical protein